MAPEGSARATDPASRFGKYDLIAKIGQGAMGEVYKARDTVLDRFVAIKTMSAAVLGDAELAQRFLREAQSAARLNHPNIVTLHEFGEQDGRLFMAMELLEGEDLKGVLKRRGLATLDDKLAVMEQILDGVGYAHAAGVVHRDLKPANIHVQPNGRVKVMDFGLARLGESEMTRAGTIMGTPNYMSPEQVRGERTGPPSDVFALGAVFYELIGGRRAFDADSMHAVLYKVTNSDPIPLAQCLPDCPPIIAAFVRKALVKEPELRYRDGSEMREALELCQRVLDGSLEEGAAIAEWGQPPTMIQTPGEADATLAQVEPATRAGSTRASPPRGASGQSGSLPLVRGTTGSSPSLRRKARPGSKPPATLGSAPAAQPSSPAPRAMASQMPLYGGAAALALLVLAGAVVLIKRPQPPVAVPEDRQAQPRALASVTVQAQLDAARRSLEAGDPEGAIAAAAKVLQVDAGNADAQAIIGRARSSRDEVVAPASATPRAAEASTAAPIAKPRAAGTTAPAAPPTTAVVAAPVNVPTALPTPLPTLAPAAPVATVAAAPPSTAAPRPALSDEAAVRQLVANLEHAIEQKDIALYKKLRPALTAEDERRLRDAFNNVSQQVEYGVDAITLDGDKATVRVTRTGRVSGQPVPAVRQVLRLVRTDAGWVIAEIGQ